MSTYALNFDQSNILSLSPDVNLSNWWLELQPNIVSIAWTSFQWSFSVFDLFVDVILLLSVFHYQSLKLWLGYMDWSPIKLPAVCFWMPLWNLESQSTRMLILFRRRSQSIVVFILMICCSAFWFNSAILKISHLALLSLIIPSSDMRLFIMTSIVYDDPWIGTVIRYFTSWGAVARQWASAIVVTVVIRSHALHWWHQGEGQSENYERKNDLIVINVLLNFNSLLYYLEFYQSCGHNLLKILWNELFMKQ